MTVELGQGNSSEKLKTSTRNLRSAKRKEVLRNDEGKRDLIGIKKEVDQSMPVGSGACEDALDLKRARLGQHRKVATESFMSLLEQKKEMRNSGLEKEDIDVLEVLNIEIKS